MSTYRRTITARLVVAVIAVPVVALSWVLFEVFNRIGGATLAIIVVLSVASFFRNQSMERLEVSEEGVSFLRGETVWAFTWSQCIGIDLVYHLNDLGAVRFAISSSDVRKIDMNWQKRRQLEETLIAMANQFGPAPTSQMPSTRRLGYRVGQAIRNAVGSTNDRNT